MEDGKIIELYFDRSESAIAETERKYGRYCRAIAGRILGDPDDCEECISDTWLRAWNAIPPNRPESLKLYLAKIGRNLALNRLEYHSAGKRAAPLEELSGLTPDRNLERQALKDALERFLRQQKAEHRQMFLRRYWYGDSIEELAARFGCTKARATGILFRLRQKLRETLEKEDLYVGT